MTGTVCGDIIVVEYIFKFDAAFEVDITKFKRMVKEQGVLFDKIDTTFLLPITADT